MTQTEANPYEDVIERLTKRGIDLVVQRKQPLGRITSLRFRCSWTLMPGTILSLQDEFGREFKIWGSRLREVVFIEKIRS